MTNPESISDTLRLFALSGLSLSCCVCEYVLLKHNYFVANIFIYFNFEIWIPDDVSFVLDTNEMWKKCLEVH